MITLRLQFMITWWEIKKNIDNLCRMSLGNKVNFILWHNTVNNKFLSLMKYKYHCSQHSIKLKTKFRDIVSNCALKVCGKWVWCLWYVLICMEFLLNIANTSRNMPCRIYTRIFCPMSNPTEFPLAYHPSKVYK